MRARAGLIACAWLALVCGCAAKKPVERSRCAPSTPSRFELRDGAGALQLAVKAAQGASAAFDLCDAGAQAHGSIELAGELAGARVVLRGSAGAMALQLERRGPADIAGSTAEGPALRLHRDGAEWRVLHPDGIPYGSLAKGPNGASAHGPGGQPLVTVEPRAEDQVARGLDGAVKYYLIPASDGQAAAVFALDGLPLDQRAAIYTALSQPGSP